MLLTDSTVREDCVPMHKLIRDLYTEPSYIAEVFECIVASSKNRFVWAGYDNNPGPQERRELVFRLQEK